MLIRINLQTAVDFSFIVTRISNICVSYISVRLWPGWIMSPQSCAEAQRTSGLPNAGLLSRFQRALTLSHAKKWVLVSPFYLFLKRFYLFLEKGREGGREEEKHQCVVASGAPPMGTWPTTQACALTGDRTSDPSVHRLALNLLSHTSQG